MEVKEMEIRKGQRDIMLVVQKKTGQLTKKRE